MVVLRIIPISEYFAYSFILLLVNSFHLHHERIQKFPRGCLFFFGGGGVCNASRSTDVNSVSILTYWHGVFTRGPNSCTSQTNIHPSTSRVKFWIHHRSSTGVNTIYWIRHWSPTGVNVLNTD